MRRAPAFFGYSKSRWQLAMLAEQVSWLRGRTTAAVCQLLTRLRIHYKRGRDYVHSPDAAYQAKVDRIAEQRQRTVAAPARFCLLYLDEVTFYRQPTVACAYEQAGRRQPLAYRSYRANTASRIVAALNALTGQVTYRQRSHIDVHCLAQFWYELRHAYPHVETLYVVVDNWPVHFHPDVLAPLQPQHLPWLPNRPANWPTTARRKAHHDNLPIQLLCLPTYASWLNPIEKLWRWLKQDILHLHRSSDDWPTLKQRVNAFLDQFAHGSSALLRYVGLLPN